MWICGIIHGICTDAERTFFGVGADRCRSEKSTWRGSRYRPWTAICAYDADLCGRLCGCGRLRAHYRYGRCSTETRRKPHGIGAQKCRDIENYHSADHSAEFRGDFVDRQQSGGYSDLCGMEDFRLSEGTGDRQWNGAGFRTVSLSAQ